MDAKQQEVYNETISPIPGEAPPQADDAEGFVQPTEEQMTIVMEMAKNQDKYVGQGVEWAIDKLHAQKPWSVGDQRAVGQAAVGVINYYLPSEFMMHPLVLLAITVGSVAVKNADVEEQERRALAGEESESAEIEEKPKRGRPKKGKKKDGDESASA